MIAYAINVEALGTTAALGAFMAPVLLGSDDANAEPAAALPREHGRRARPGRGAARLAAHHVRGRRELFRRGSRGRERRRRADGAAALRRDRRDRGTLRRPPRAVVGDPVAHLLRRLGAAGGGRATGWRPHWPVFVAALVLSGAGLVARAAASRVLPIRFGAGSPAGGPGAAEGWSAGEALYFFTTPLLLAWARLRAGARSLRRRPRVCSRCWSRCPICSPGICGGAGLVRPDRVPPRPPSRPRPSGTAPPRSGRCSRSRCSGRHLDHPLGRTDGRWYGVLTWLLAAAAPVQRRASGAPPADAAFVGPWALALWGVTAVALALAAGLIKAEPKEGEARLVRAGLWLVRRPAGAVRRHRRDPAATSS